MDNKKQAHSSLVDLIKNMPPTPPLTKDNATTPYAVKALTEAQNGNLTKLVNLATFDWEDRDEDSLKALALFEETAFSSEPHWLTEMVYNLVECPTVENTLGLIEVLRVCPAFYLKVASRIVDLASTPYRKKLERLKTGWQHGSAKTNQRYEEVRDHCVKEASDIWENNPSTRIGYVCKALHDTLKRKINWCPNKDKIREYLIDAEQKGLLKIPPEARKGGRPRRDED